MKSTNEWDPLKKVIVGVADYARIPEMDKSLRHINYADRQDVSDVISGLYPKQVIDEANEDLENFVNFLKVCGVEVVRPHPEPTGYYNFCPRDLVVVHGETEIAAPMPLKARQYNFGSIAHYFNYLTPVTCTYNDALYNENCIGDKDTLALTEYEPALMLPTSSERTIRSSISCLIVVTGKVPRNSRHSCQRPRYTS